MVRFSEPFRLSTTGSTRATAYWFANKSVTLGGKTHVVWLDAVAQVCGRTYDHASSVWGDTIRLFEGCDNHTNPALTADEAGHLHLAYGPHGFGADWNQGRFNHVVSSEPGSLESWEPGDAFGYSATYASMVNSPSGVDCIVYRGGEKPCQLMFQKQRPLGGWTSAKALMHQEIPPQYTNVGARIICTPDGTLYVGGHFYNKESAANSKGAAALKSTDMGATWTDLKGEPAEVPIVLEERFAIPHPGGEQIYLSGLAVDPAGDLWAATMNHSIAPMYGQLSHWTGDVWETVDIGPCLPEDRVPQAGPIAFDTRGRLHLVLSSRRRDAEGPWWGNSSEEVFHLVSDGGTGPFECNQVSPTDEAGASWLPSLSLPGPSHPVDDPVIIYTRGSKGEGLKPATTTEVYCVFVEL
ncbi:MAG: BNR-4 repeat-containing protein [Candidatus Latescibacteria bacterium]|jgi:hypothetical protein|nr:BNR-4 repeat-containing protein [Candidatus Latescibacterota bacterium]